MIFKEGRTFVIAEVGINHQGSLQIAKDLIDAAVDAGCDAVKFQKRTPLMSLPPHLWDQVRDTPWGVRMTYREYREKIELSSRDYECIAEYCKDRITWFASPWDTNAADTLFHLGCPIFKIPSAMVTNLELVEHVAKFKRPVIMSTGMSDFNMVYDAINVLAYHLPLKDIHLLACTSKYPAPIDTLNLQRIYQLRDSFADLGRIGYSGHEAGLWTTLCAVAMGATIIERHLTLDRALPGSDHAASVEPHGMKTLVREIRNFEKARGTGDLRILDCEQADVKRLRG
jgi:N-acetylneuraminate synthase